MKYEIFGPFPLPRSDRGYIHFNRAAQNTFWEELEIEGLSTACGCYVFATKASRGAKPWYVGKAEKQSFAKESFTADKLVKYNSALEGRSRGIPVMLFYARTTTSGAKFSKPTARGYADVQYLEKLLIGAGLKRNPSLINIKDTRLLKEMKVPGLINNGKGRLVGGPQFAKNLFSY